MTLSGRSARLLGAALLATAFGAGVFSGFALDRVLEARGGSALAQSGKKDGRGHYESILGRLDLSAEQRARVDAVLERRRAQTDAFWERDGARLRTIVDSTRAEVRAVLNPEQRAAYDRLRAEHRAWHRARGDAHGKWATSPSDSDRRDGAPGGRTDALPGETNDSGID